MSLRYFFFFAWKNMMVENMAGGKCEFGERISEKVYIHEHDDKMPIRFRFIYVIYFSYSYMFYRLFDMKIIF